MLSMNIFSRGGSPAVSIKDTGRHGRQRGLDRPDARRSEQRPMDPAPRMPLTIAVSLCLVFAAISSHAAPPKDGFVRVQGAHFELDGKPYYFLGTNFWQGMNLGSKGPGGDRDRLLRELDKLAAIGIDNLRVMGASEGPNSEPWRMVPALQKEPGVYDLEVLDGLDYLLDQMGRRGLKAVVVLNNFWPWSGGMAQYVHWFDETPIPYPPPAAGGDWNTFQKYSARFYSNKKAVQAFRKHVRFILEHKNPYTGRALKDEPAVMAWELANEPRGGGDAARLDRWLKDTAAYVKSIDSKHLVTTGCEGETPWPQGIGMDFVRDHSGSDIDYATAHMWVQNWDWYDPAKADVSFSTAEARMGAYFNDHVRKAAGLGKPVVFEEFGLARDSGSFEPSASTAWRDRYYGDVFGKVYEAARSTSTTVAGVNFWAWAGEAVPQSPGGLWSAGSPWTGDPPHERQGWYSVYDGDTSTLRVIADWADKFNALDDAKP